MNFPEDLKYTKDHEWVKLDGNVATIGITDFAQDELGEVVFVELPEIGSEFNKADSICVVESTKAASDVYAPIGGKVIEVNSNLADSPELINSSPYSDAWLVKLENPNLEDLEKLMSVEEYKNHVS
ncbi:MAG: glycine cleavage system protein GcvH [Bdellovibrionales bacterium]|nr:glycine cleavage system protein GcvH [Bdellovibrionales bacterium]